MQTTWTFSFKKPFTSSYFVNCKELYRTLLNYGTGNDAFKICILRKALAVVQSPKVHCRPAIKVCLSLRNTVWRWRRLLVLGIVNGVQSTRAPPTQPVIVTCTVPDYCHFLSGGRFSISFKTMCAFFTNIFFSFVNEPAFMFSCMFFLLNRNKTYVYMSLFSPFNICRLGSTTFKSFHYFPQQNNNAVYKKP